MSLQVTEFNVAKFLADDQAIAIYLGDAFENEDAYGIVDALNDVVSSRGGTAQLASSTGVAEDIVHEALRDTPSPNFAAILAVLHGLRGEADHRTRCLMRCKTTGKEKLPLCLSFPEGICGCSPSRQQANRLFGDVWLHF